MPPPRQKKGKEQARWLRCFQSRFKHLPAAHGLQATGRPGGDDDPRRRQARLPLGCQLPASPRWRGPTKEGRRGAGPGPPGGAASPLRSSRSQTLTMSAECLRWWMSQRLSVCTLCCELLSSDSFRSSAASEKADIPPAAPGPTRTKWRQHWGLQRRQADPLTSLPERDAREGEGKGAAPPTPESGSPAPSLWEEPQGGGAGPEEVAPCYLKR